MPKHNLLQHILKNRFWFITALEIYSLALYFVVKKNYFLEYPPKHTILYYLDDPIAIFFLACAGTLVMVYSIWDFQWFYSLPIVVTVSMMVFMLYFGGFITLDLDVGKIGIGTVLTAIIILRIIGESWQSGGSE